MIALADELDGTGTLPDELWERLGEHWSDAQLIELVVVTGMYRLVSYLVNALRIEPEAWAALPPVIAATRS